MKVFWVAILAGLLSGPLLTQNADAKGKIVGRCAVEGDRLLLSGLLTPAFDVSCVERFVSQGGNQIEIDLDGGDAVTAIRLAEILYPAKPTLFITGGCYSSCANYLVPVAKQIVFEPRSIVMTHGSPADIAEVETEKHLTEVVRNLAIENQSLTEDKQAQLLQQGLEQARGIVKLHDDFVRKHGVPLGYFGSDATVVWPAGELGRCFPDITIEQPIVDKKGTEKRARKLLGAETVYGRADDRCPM